MFIGEGVLERLITHLSIWSLHVWVLMGLLLGGSPGVVWVAIVLVEGVGAHGCGKNTGSGGSCRRSR